MLPSLPQEDSKPKTVDLALIKEPDPPLPSTPEEDLAKQEQQDAWTPAVLTEYEIGRAILAAETIARSEKPVAEIGCQKVASIAALEDDLRECVNLAGHADNVRVWTRATSGGRLRYGFYREEWALDALDFLDRADLSDVDRAWISGLVYGYRSDAIQQFISRTGRQATK